MSDAREAGARSILLEHGLAQAEVQAVGPEGEIAAVQVREDQWALLLDDESAGVLAGIRALGFRYVALDLVALAS